MCILDSLENAHPEVLARLRRLSGVEPGFAHADIRDRDAVRSVLEAGVGGAPFDAVIHFAGRKAVSESVEDPLGYWSTNVTGTLVLLEELHRAGVFRFVFSSSCTVYDMTATPPFDETLATGPINPYGRTKLAVETVLRDLPAADPRWSISILRYFNPVGAHPSGDIGEDPNGIPNNLMPFITQVAVGRREELAIFGDDYDTSDGTCIRDYIHVVDLARGHVAALAHVSACKGCHTHNLGTGNGYSVKQVVEAFGRATGIEIAHRIAPRRAGDAPAAWADTRAARETLGWEAALGLDEMCRDAWNWQRRNPNGFGNEDHD